MCTGGEHIRKLEASWLLGLQRYQARWKRGASNCPSVDAHVVSAGCDCFEYQATLGGAVLVEYPARDVALTVGREDTHDVYKVIAGSSACYREDVITT